MASSRLLGVAASLLAAMLLAGCTSAAGQGEQVVFSEATGFSQGGPATTMDVIDVILQRLANTSDNSVQLRGVTLVSAPAAVRIKSVTAYYPGPGGGIVTGDLLKLCRQSSPPSPLSADITPAHSESDWSVVIALTFAKPGHYQLNRVKILYTTNGQAGWQYQNINTTITVSAASPGTKPAFSGCGPVDLTVFPARSR
jgi:hypothetical protein